MLEKPALPHEAITATLRANYGIPVAALDFLPIGNDATGWVYRVTADNERTYFLKVKRGILYQASLSVPRYLKDTGIEEVVAPLPTVTGDLFISLGDYSLILYPFIEGSTGMAFGLSDSQWVEFGTILRQIHATALPPDLSRQVQSETFSPKWEPLVRRLQADIAASRFGDGDGTQKELASFWMARSEEIERIVDRAAALGRMLQPTPSEFVLCHTDIHTANVLIDGKNELHIVDWDMPLLAPRERDLMFVAGAPSAVLFFKGYGQTAIDPVALAYYRYEWVVQELGDCGDRVFLMQDVGPETRRDALRSFIALFGSGDVVGEAYRADADLGRTVS